jgi:hypothetical protein
MFQLRRPVLFRTSTLIAFLAAIMLVIGGAPARASTNPCNPCPPDCPMMAQMAKAAAVADHHTEMPGKSGKAENPCKSGLACQAAFAVPLLLQTAAETIQATEAADHSRLGQLAAASRPPDRNLRPPILL